MNFTLALACTSTTCWRTDSWFHGTLLRSANHNKIEMKLSWKFRKTVIVNNQYHWIDNSCLKEAGFRSHSKNNNHMKLCIKETEDIAWQSIYNFQYHILWTLEYRNWDKDGYRIHGDYFLYETYNQPLIILRNMMGQSCQ